MLGASSAGETRSAAATALTWSRRVSVRCPVSTIDKNDPESPDSSARAAWVSPRRRRSPRSGLPAAQPPAGCACHGYPSAARQREFWAKARCPSGGLQCHSTAMPSQAAISMQAVATVIWG